MDIGFARLDKPLTRSRVQNRINRHGSDSIGILLEFLYNRVTMKQVKLARMIYSLNLSDSNPRRHFARTRWSPHQLLQIQSACLPTSCNNVICAWPPSTAFTLNRTLTSQSAWNAVEKSDLQVFSISRSCSGRTKRAPALPIAISVKQWTKTDRQTTVCLDSRGVEW